MTPILTVTEIYDNVISDFETAYGITIPTEGKVALRAFAASQAAALKLYYLAMANVQKNIWPDLADPASAGGTLERFGLVKLDRLPFPATAGVYTATVTGATGAVIPAQTQFKSDDTSLSPGYLFILDSAYTMPSGTGTITLRALTAGRDSLLAVGNTVTAVIPLNLVNQQATIASITTDPINAETTEEYRAKVVEAYRLTPQGGAAVDYVLWGLEVSGTRKIYPYTAPLDEINVYVEATPSSSTDGHGTPTPTILSNVDTSIETDPDTGLGRRPMGVFVVNVLPISALAIDVVINSGGSITVAQQAIIDTAIEEALFLVRPFIAAVDAVADRNDNISAYWFGNVIITAVSSVVIATINFTVAGNPVTSYTFDNGEIPYLNSVVYI